MVIFLLFLKQAHACPRAWACSLLIRCLDTSLPRVLKNLIFSFFFFLECITQHVGSQFLNQGLNPCPQNWKHGVLTTGHSGKALLYLNKYIGLAKKFVQVFLYDFLHRKTQKKFGQHCVCVCVCVCACACVCRFSVFILIW